MFVASYHNTERGAARIAADKVRAAQLGYGEIVVNELPDLSPALCGLKREAERKREAALLAAKEFAEACRLEMGPQPFRHSHALIERRLCRVFRIRRDEIRSERRDRRVVLARQAIMYWSARLTMLSLPSIGRLMGGRDHTTVLHGRNVYPSKRAKMGRHLPEAR